MSGATFWFISFSTDSEGKLQELTIANNRKAFNMYMLYTQSVCIWDIYLTASLFSGNTCSPIINNQGRSSKGTVVWSKEGLNEAIKCLHTWKMPMKSLLGLSYRARMQGTDFTAEVLQWLITARRKIILSVLGGTAGATSMQGLQGGFPVPAQRRLSVPSTHSYKGCQKLPVSAQQRLNSLFLNPKRLLSHPMCKKASADWCLSTNYDQLLWFMVWRGGTAVCQFPVGVELKIYSFPLNPQPWHQYWHECVKIELPVHPWQSSSHPACAYTPSPASHSPVKCAWMGSLTEKLLWGSCSSFRMMLHYQHIGYGIGWENTN